MIPGACRVALPIPAQQAYRYRVPQGLADRVTPGARVVVPVRGREVVGIVTVLEPDDDEGLKAVLLAPDTTPLVPPPLLDLATWMSRYYATPIGLTLRAMLPTPLWGESRLIAEVVEGAPTPAGGTSADLLAALKEAGLFRVFRGDISKFDHL